MTPQTKLLSPTGKNALGTTMKSQTVPARQTTQINADTQRKRRNHQSDLPYTPRTRFSIPPITRSIQVFLAPSPRSLSSLRAHERRQGERHQPRCDDRDNNGDGELAEDAAHQAGHETPTG